MPSSEIQEAGHVLAIAFYLSNVLFFVSCVFVGGLFSKMIDLARQSLHDD